MKPARRVFLRQTVVAGGTSLALVCGADCWARWNLDAFRHTEADEAMLAVLQGEGAKRSSDIRVELPSQHYNKALVPVAVTTHLPDVEAISILVDSEYDPLAATFMLGQRSVSRVSTRLKLEGSTRIWALAKTGQGYLLSNQAVELVPLNSHNGKPQPSGN